MKGHGMLFCNCICAWQPVRVVHGDGHVRSLTRPITVEELLQCHPHHFVCEPTSNGPLYHSGMLPLDMELEEGRIYLLLPLPRLLPHLASHFSSPPSCPCFTHPGALDSAQNYGNPPGKAFGDDHPRVRNWIVRNRGQFLVAANTMRRFSHRVARSKLGRAVVRMSRSVLPERLLFRLSFEKLENADLLSKSSSSSGVGKSVQYSSRNRWRPGLECILEVDLLTGLLRDSGVSHRM